MFGCRPSPEDHRDFVFGKIVAGVSLPKQFSVEKECSPVRDQGKFGTCCAFAGAGIKDWQERKNYFGRQIVTSPLFLYQQCKQQDGIPNEEGTYPRVVMKSLQGVGICREAAMPYENMVWPGLPKPSQEVIEEAKTYVIKSYARLYSLEDIKQAIFQSGPVLAGVFCTGSFLIPEYDFVPMPGGRILGGHAIALVGWDDSLVHTYATDGKTRTGFLRIRNSWGVGWGENGYAWLPYDYYYGKLDIGVPYFFEAWSSLDLVVPVPSAKEIVLWIGRNVAQVDGEEIQIDQPPAIDAKSGRTLVPLRFVAENMGWKVEWVASEKKIILAKGG